MEKKPKNKWLSFLADGMLSGLMIGIGCVVSMSCENRFLIINVLAVAEDPCPFQSGQQIWAQTAL